MNQSRLQYFAERKAEGKLTSSEQKELAQLLEVDPANATAFSEMLDILLISSEVLEQTDPQTDANWEGMLGLIAEAEAETTDNVVPLRRKPKPWLAIAATIALLAVVGIWASGILDSETKAGLGDIYAAEGHLEKQVKLKDGSLIQLQPGAKLTVSADYNVAERRLKLEGQAYFEVHHDPARPFIVSAGKTETKVLGTRFHINARSLTTAIKVSVEEGKVGFSAASGNAEILLADQAAVYEPETGAIIRVQKFDPANLDKAVAVTNLVIKNTPLQELLPQLEAFYGVKLSFPAELLESRITATFEKGDPYQEMATVLKLILQCKVEQHENSFSFTR
ncbi:MAG TPA: DUF4974 domain-containing protein [Bacteroidetes bacterium]|nr:DUF4974 domain-containing protein [Bacteroidota bacterium]